MGTKSANTHPEAMIVIPAYQPTSVPLDLVNNLQSDTMAKSRIPILIVDDGSSTSNSQLVFESLTNKTNVTIIKHKVNQGKGYALKQAIIYAKSHDAPFIVTADADGQHLAKDILYCVKQAQKDSQFTIGVREFGRSTPFKSFIGNKITSIIFYLVTRTWLVDTQSGLRIIPRSLFNDFLTFPQNKFDFELVCLLYVARNNTIRQIPINTIYQPKNPHSHFRPLMDSTLIYFSFFRFFIIAPLIALIDFSGFLLLSTIMHPSIAFLVIRFITVIVYFVKMKQVVFRISKCSFRQTFRFFVLAGLQYAIR